MTSIDRNRTGRKSAVAAIALLAAAAGAAPAEAGQVSYEYDPLGRLVRANRTGGYEARYAYDKADNRLSYSVTGASAPAPRGAAVVVVPLNGFKVVPLGQ